MKTAVADALYERAASKGSASCSRLSSGKGVGNPRINQQTSKLIGFFIFATFWLTRHSDAIKRAAQSIKLGLSANQAPTTKVCSNATSFLQKATNLRTNLPVGPYTYSPGAVSARHVRVMPAESFPQPLIANRHPNLRPVQGTHEPVGQAVTSRAVPGANPQKVSPPTTPPCQRHGKKASSQAAATPQGQMTYAQNERCCFCMEEMPMDAHVSVGFCENGKCKMHTACLKACQADAKSRGKELKCPLCRGEILPENRNIIAAFDWERLLFPTELIDAMHHYEDKLGYKSLFLSDSCQIALRKHIRKMLEILHAYRKQYTVIILSKSATPAYLCPESNEVILHSPRQQLKNLRRKLSLLKGSNQELLSALTKLVELLDVKDDYLNLDSNEPADLENYFKLKYGSNDPRQNKIPVFCHLGDSRLVREKMNMRQSEPDDYRKEMKRILIDNGLADNLCNGPDGQMRKRLLRSLKQQLFVKRDNRMAYKKVLIFCNNSLITHFNDGDTVEFDFQNGGDSAYFDLVHHYLLRTPYSKFLWVCCIRRADPSVEDEPKHICNLVESYLRDYGQVFSAMEVVRTNNWVIEKNASNKFEDDFFVPKPDNNVIGRVRYRGNKRWTQNIAN